MISLIYPDAPGAKVAGTSAEAGKAMKETAQALREKCLTVLKWRNSTADEVADFLGKSILSVRPRISELGALGFIFKSGVRRKNASGCNATVWTTEKPFQLTNA